MKTLTDYNGWKNKATWNVALWIGNDESLYNAAISYAKSHSTTNKLYAGFLDFAGLRGERTPDGFKYDGKDLDYKSLSAMIKELANS